MKYIIKNVSSKEELEKSIDFYRMIFQGISDIDNPVYAIEKWTERMKMHSDLMLYVSSDNEVIAMAFARVNDSSSMTIGPVAVHENYRGVGIAKEMVILLEERAMQNGIKKINLGAVESAERFYSKLGYRGSLLIQSQSHSIEELLSLKSNYKVEFTNIYDNKVSQVCLELTEVDKDIQKKYETKFSGCYTMMLYQKELNS